MGKDELYEDLRKKYVQKLSESLDDKEQVPRTQQYAEFRKAYLPKPLSWYEKACNAAAKILPVSPDKSRRPQIERAIRTCHLQMTPEGVGSFALLAPLLLILAGALVFYLLPMLLWGSGSLFVTIYIAILGVILIIPLGRIPEFLSTSWRMKASNQMVLCIFYVVTYMRHTSNLELAIDFAAEHLAAPLSLDMKKIIWNLETEKYDSLRESLESYLEDWRGYNDEFIESMHLVESSLVETTEGRRLDALDKALSVMLEETYEKMLHYAHNLKSPLTTLHMLGIILPILGLIILPLLVAFMPEVRWYHLFLLYNVTLPVLVYFIGSDILSKRPTGYSGTAEDDAQAKHGQSLVSWGKMTFTPLFFGLLIMTALVLIGILPLLMHAANPEFDLVVRERRADDACIMGFCPVNPTVKEQVKDAKFWFNEYRDIIVDQESGETINVGPFGIVATLLSLFVPLGLGLGVGVYYRIRVRNLVKQREEAKKLELEFAAALFQLGNRLADGLPLEISFSKVAAVLPDTVSGRFFTDVSINITKLGLSVEDAIFHEKYGAIRNYPSNLIESSMKVLVESSRKGPLIASQAIINVSNYIKEMHRVDERLKDLMADVISSMKSQIKFLTPTIAGIVIGITSMITAILGKLGAKMSDLTAETSGNAAGMGAGASILGSLSGGGVPTYFFQIVVGLYVVELIFVLTILVNGIENGTDKTAEHAMLGDNMIHSTITYCVLAFIVILLFNIVAASIVPASMT
jgi:hypothetical protein